MRRSYCKTCGKKYASRTLADPISKVLTGAKYRARRKGVPFLLSRQDVSIPELCPALGIPLVRGNGKTRDASPTLDRISPALGYVRGNVEVVSHLANRIKNNGTAEQIIAVGHWLQKRSTTP